MLELLASIIPDSARDIFDIGLVLAFVLGIGWLLRQLRQTRAALTAEVVLQMKADQDERDAGMIPQPLHVKSAIEFATKEQVQELKDDLDKSRKERDEKISEVLEKIEEGARTEVNRGDQIHSRINRVVLDLGEVKGELKGVSQGVQNITNILMNGSTRKS